jgi:hypothetical protein
MQLNASRTPSPVTLASRHFPTLAAQCFVAVATLMLARPAHADEEIERLREKARALVEELETELDAVREERRQLEAERRAMERQRAVATPPVAASAPPPPAAAPAGSEPPPDSEGKFDILAAEVERLKEQFVLPATKEYKSQYGLGPAASKIYDANRGLSIGGYGEANYSGKVSDDDDESDRADFLRFVLYTGYKFSDRLLLNSEIEFEHATTASTVTSSGGSVSVEFAYLDYLYAPPLNLRAGLVLVPLGFLNEIHEPPFFYGNNRPEVERRIIPSTWRELGAGVFGNLGGDLAYRAYLMTSLNAEGFEDTGIRDGRQSGNRVVAESPAGAVRLDYTPRQVPGALLGAAAFLGDTGQDQSYDGRTVDAFLSLWEVHAQYRARGLSLRALAAFGSLDDAATLSIANQQTIADRFEGWYAEAAYDVMPLLLPDLPTQSLEPFFRYEHVDTQAGVPTGFVRELAEDVAIYTIGVSYKPHPQVVLKLDYRNLEPRRGPYPDEVNVGLGFIF